MAKPRACLGARVGRGLKRAEPGVFGWVKPSAFRLTPREQVYYNSGMLFVWDPRKAASNARKHRVTFDEAVTVFADPLAFILDDGRHPDRALIVGRSIEQRTLLVVFVEVDDDRTRIISARRATNPERRRYEEGVE